LTSFTLQCAINLGQIQQVVNNRQVYLLIHDVLAQKLRILDPLAALLSSHSKMACQLVWKQICYVILLCQHLCIR